VIAVLAAAIDGGVATVAMKVPQLNFCLLAESSSPHSLSVADTGNPILKRHFL